MGYIENKAAENARAICARWGKGVDPTLSYRLSHRLLKEARASILKLLGDNPIERWKSMDFSDRAALCTLVVRALLDKDRLCQFLSGERGGLI